jgi:molybdopterin-containing oxidoreductase family iron-sulfur binding subunit
MAASGPARAFELPGRMSPSPESLKAKRWGMVVDMRRCPPGCSGDCIKACHTVHNVPFIPSPEHEVMWLFREPYKNAFPEQSRGLAGEGVGKGTYLLLCNHCDDPPCVRVCPTQATFKREEDGIVMMDYHRCIGCRFCMAACPYGSRSFNFRDPRPFIPKITPDYPTRGKGVVEKCNFCQERLALGRGPACVEACPEGVLTFGDLADPHSEVSKILARSPHMRRKPELGTRPSVYYLV